MRRPSIAALVVLLSCLLAATASGQQREAAAKEAFFAGKAAYEAKHFDEALEQFKRCYTLGGQPALLYNIASTLQNLNRPGEAADALREYATARPESAAGLEERIAALGRAQQIIDRDAAREQKRRDEELARRERELELQRAAQARGAGWLTQNEADQRLELVKQRERKRKRTLGLALGIGLGTLAVGGIVVGVVCGLGKCASGPTQDYDFGKVTVTQ